MNPACILTILFLVRTTTLLPVGSRVIEMRPLPNRGHLLVLWMLRPSDDGCAADPDEPYAPSAPGMTRGCFLRGPTRVSVQGENTLKDTVRIVGPMETTDSFDVPYVLGREGPYYIPGRARFSKPQLLRLRDYNGDGKPLEIAFFDAESGSDLLTTVIGYEPDTDRLRHFTFHVVLTEPDGMTRTYDDDWLQGLFWFRVRPHRPPQWKFEAEYPGGPHESYDVSYNPRERRFDVRVSQRAGS